MSCTPTLTQSAFRLRDDNGDETTASWLFNENANGTIDIDKNFRVRFVAQVTNACAASNAIFQLQYSLNSGTWTNVTGSSSVVRSTASPNLADAANLTDQMTAGTGTFIGATGFDEADGAAGGNNLDIVASGHAQVEYCLQMRSADVADNDNVQLRITHANLATWSQTPSITANAPTPIPKTFDDSWAIEADQPLTTLMGDHFLQLVDLDALPLADAVDKTLGEAGGTSPINVNNLPVDDLNNWQDTIAGFFTLSASITDAWANEADVLAAFMTYAAVLSDPWANLADAVDYDLETAATTPINVNTLPVDDLNNWADSILGRFTYAATLTDSWTNEADALAGRETYAATYSDPWGNLADSITVDLQAPDITKTYSDPWTNLADTALRTIGDHLLTFAADSANNWADQAAYTKADAQTGKTFTASDSLNQWAEPSYALFGDYLVTESDGWANLADTFSYDKQDLAATPIEKSFTDAWENLADSLAAIEQYRASFSDAWGNLTDALSLAGQGSIEKAFTDGWANLGDSRAAFESLNPTFADSALFAGDLATVSRGYSLPLADDLNFWADQRALFMTRAVALTDAWANLQDSVLAAGSGDLIRAFIDTWETLGDSLAARMNYRAQVTDNWQNLADQLEVLRHLRAGYTDAWANLADQAAAVQRLGLRTAAFTDATLNNWADQRAIRAAHLAALIDSWQILADSAQGFFTYAVRLSEAWATLADEVSAGQQSDLIRTFADAWATLADTLAVQKRYLVIVTDDALNLGDQASINQGLLLALSDQLAAAADQLALRLAYLAELSDDWRNLSDFILAGAEGDLFEQLTDEMGTLADVVLAVKSIVNAVVDLNIVVSASADLELIVEDDESDFFVEIQDSVTVD